MSMDGTQAYHYTENGLSIKSSARNMIEKIVDDEKSLTFKDSRSNGSGSKFHNNLRVDINDVKHELHATISVVNILTDTTAKVQFLIEDNDFGVYPNTLNVRGNSVEGIIGRDGDVYVCMIIRV